MSVWHSTDIDLQALTRLGDNGLPGHIGIEFVEIGDDWLKARMPVDRRTHQPFGRLHGGASVALAETVGSVAGSLTVDRETSVVVGMEINANHVRPVSTGWVTATVTPASVGRRAHVWEIRIVDEAGRLVCISRCTLAVIEQRSTYATPDARG